MLTETLRKSRKTFWLKGLVFGAASLSGFIGILYISKLSAFQLNFQFKPPSFQGHPVGQEGWYIHTVVMAALNKRNIHLQLQRPVTARQETVT